MRSSSTFSKSTPLDGICSSTSPTVEASLRSVSGKSRDLGMVNAYLCALEGIPDEERIVVFEDILKEAKDSHVIVATMTALARTGAGADVFFVLMGAILVFAMHAGFAFLEVGTVQHKNQVNALVKIMVDFAVSTTTYFFIGFAVAYGITFFANAAVLTGQATSAGGPAFALSGYDPGAAA